MPCKQTARYVIVETKYDATDDNSTGAMLEICEIEVYGMGFFCTMRFVFWKSFKCQNNMDILKRYDRLNLKMTEAIVHFQNFTIKIWNFRYHVLFTPFKALYIPQKSNLSNSCVAFKISVLTNVFDVTYLILI